MRRIDLNADLGEGFGPWRILRLVLGETLLLVPLGGLPGLGLAWLVVIWLGDSLVNFIPNMVMLPEILLGGLGIGFEGEGLIGRLLRLLRLGARRGGR